MSRGGFTCTVSFRDGRVETDENAFTTALVLRELTPGDERVQGALDFLERCADPALAGAFGFWPRDERPAWARRVPPDCDDTAVVALELLRAGRRTVDDTIDVLMASLITEVARFGPAWIRPLTFPTWLDGHFRSRANPVDCAVNANVLALLAYCGLQALPGYAESIAMIEGAVASIAHRAPRDRALWLHSLTPYYPDPRVFALMLDHAVRCGAVELRPAGAALRALLGPADGPLVLCGNAYGGPLWRCQTFERQINGSPNRQ
jgi:hypothetical protein